MTSRTSTSSPPTASKKKKMERKVCESKADKFAEKQTSYTKLKNRKASVYFAALMDLCHHKHSELAEHFQKYRGPVVPRGDNVNDDTGCQAVFTFQGASTSQMTAARVVDTVSRLPGN